MTEYIDREEAKNLLELALEDDWEVRYAEDRLDEIPAADAVSVVHGRWKGEGMGDYRCSLCGFVVSGNGYRFCPACGAKMDEEG